MVFRKRLRRAPERTKNGRTKQHEEGTAEEERVWPAAYERYVREEGSRIQGEAEQQDSEDVDSWEGHQIEDMIREAEQGAVEVPSDDLSQYRDDS